MKSGPFQDQRPWFRVFVTGHPDVVESGAWAYSPVGRRSFTHAGAAQVRSYLDAVLWQRRETHRVLVYCRAGRGLSAGIDDTVRAYCELRGIDCSPESPEWETHGDESGFRRDLATVARSHAVVWFGDRQERDPVTLAIWLGIVYRVVPLVTAEECDQIDETEGVCDGPLVQAGRGETHPQNCGRRHHQGG